MGGGSVVLGTIHLLTYRIDRTIHVLYHSACRRVAIPAPISILVSLRLAHLYCFKDAAKGDGLCRARLWWVRRNICCGCDGHHPGCRRVDCPCNFSVIPGVADSNDCGIKYKPHRPPPPSSPNRPPPPSSPSMADEHASCCASWSSH